MPLKALKALFTHPTARNVSPDSAQYHLIRANIIQQKKLLRRIYLNWYRILGKSIPQDPDGIVLEIGSSTGFSKKVIRGTVTSDIVDTSAVDMVFDAQFLPFKKNSLRAIIMVDVFHHIPDVELFLRDATRCVVTGGVIAMIEPWTTIWSALIYKYFHHEAFDKHARDWKFQQGGPLSLSNQALAWIVFERDRKIFDQKFQEWKITSTTLHSPIKYLLSGGISMRALWPDKLYSILRLIEYLLVPLNRYVAMFATIILKKTSSSALQTKAGYPK